VQGLGFNFFFYNGDVCHGWLSSKKNKESISKGCLCISVRKTWLHKANEAKFPMETWFPKANGPKFPMETWFPKANGPKFPREIWLPKAKCDQVHHGNRVAQGKWAQVLLLTANSDLSTLNDFQI
jgi:hypothetical protein